ncbi:9277_t:CDS:10, partial [Funneliformis caledonium]
IAVDDPDYFTFDRDCLATIISCEEAPAEAIERASKALTLVQPFWIGLRPFNHSTFLIAIWNNEKKSPLIIDFWKTIISVQKRKLVDSVERTVLLDELTTSAIRSTLQNDNQVHLVRENVTNRLKHHRDEEETERASTRLKKAFSRSSMEGPDIRNYFSQIRSEQDEQDQRSRTPEDRIYSRYQPQDLDELLEADLGKFEENQPITNNEKLNQSKTKADSRKPANKAPTSTNTVKGGKKNNTEKEIFLELSRQIYPLIKPFIKLSMLEAEELYSQIACGINITASLPDDVKQYLKRILNGDIKNALGRLDQPLIDNPSPLLLWTREVSRHFILYYHYGAKLYQEKNCIGEIDNEAHNDRTYNINYDQKPSNSGCVPKNDAVIYQDKSATIIYEQSYSPKEYTFSHYLGDFSKLACNSVDDLNYYFTRYANCTTATAKTFKSVSIHGYKYNVSVYVTDIIRIKTYRIYE